MFYDKHQTTSTKSVIYQIQRKTLSDSATKVLLFITYLKATDQ